MASRESLPEVPRPEIRREAAVDSKNARADRSPQQPEPLPAPPLRNLLLEARWMAEWFSGVLAGNLVDLPEGDGHGVLLLPGFLAGDGSLAPMSRLLRRLGYRTYRSGIPINTGPTPATVERLRRRVPEVIHRSRGPISIIGQSLGGIYAREIARRTSGEVRMVITLGSPFRDSENTRAAGLANRFSGRWEKSEARLRGRLYQPLAIPTTSVYSRTDGIVHWRACLDEPGPRRENIEVRTSHIGMSVHASVFRIVADRLAQPPGQWRPWQPERGRNGNA